MAGTNWLRRTFETGAGMVLGVGTLVLMAAEFVGWAYWMWMAIQLGHFWMFVIGLLGPLALIAGLLGAWSLVFAAPAWVLG